MAKDKGKKKADKATDDGEFAKPSEAPAGDSWSLTDGDKPKSGSNDGDLFLITPLRKETVKTKDYGEKECIVADVVHLNEKKPAKSVEHEDVYIFGGWLMGAIRSSIDTGKQVLGRLDKAADSSAGRGYVWKLEDADEDDIEVARAYLKSTDPFPKKGGKVETKAASKSKDEKSAKKKKAEPEPEPKKAKDKGKKKK